LRHQFIYNQEVIRGKIQKPGMRNMRKCRTRMGCDCSMGRGRFKGKMLSISLQLGISVYQYGIVACGGLIPFPMDGQSIGLAGRSAWIHPLFLSISEQNKRQLIKMPMESTIRTKRKCSSQFTWSIGCQDG